MVRISSLALCLLGAIAISAQSDDDEQGRNADCQNGCFLSSFPSDSCNNDPRCMCSDERFEQYYCCMAEKCAPEVLPEAMGLQIQGCESHQAPNPDDFDVKAVCGDDAALSATATTESSATRTQDSDPTDSAAAASESGSQASESAAPDSGSGVMHVGAVLPVIGVVVAGLGVMQ